MYRRDRNFEESVCSGTTYMRARRRALWLAWLALATVEADGRYCHLTFLEGFTGAIPYTFSPDGLGATRRRGRGMVRRDRDWALDAIACIQHGMGDLWRLLPCDLPRLAVVRVSQVNIRPIASRAALGERPIPRMTKGLRRPERYKVPPAWRPTALHKTSKDLETEKRPGKEKDEVMTADEILVGIDNSPSARAARWAAAYPRSTGQRFAPLIWSTGRRHSRCPFIP